MGIRREFKPRGISPEEARSSHLKALGKSQEWYDSKFQEQNGTCAVCHEPETRTGLDGNVRPLVANVAGDCLLCRKCSARENKRTQRQRDTDYKALKAKRAVGPQTVQEHWRANRNGLSESERVAHEYRDGLIINHICSANAWMAEGDVDDEEGREILRESIREFCEEVSERGTVDVACVDWQDETKKLQSVADGLYHHYGYYQAIPSIVASRFIEYAERALGIDPYPYAGGYFHKRIARILAALDGEQYTDPDFSVRCATLGCRETTTRAIGEIPPAQWFCETCTTVRQQAGQAFLSTVRNKQLEESRSVNQPRTAWTPFTTQAEERAAIFDEAGKYGG